MKWYARKWWRAVRYYWPRAKMRKRVLRGYREALGDEWVRTRLTRKPWWIP